MTCASFNEACPEASQNGSTWEINSWTNLSGKVTLATPFGNIAKSTPIQVWGTLESMTAPFAQERGAPNTSHQSTTKSMASSTSVGVPTTVKMGSSTYNCNLPRAPLPFRYLRLGLPNKPWAVRAASD